MADCLIVAISKLISALHPAEHLVSQTLHKNVDCKALFWRCIAESIFKKFSKFSKFGPWKFVGVISRFHSLKVY